MNESLGFPSVDLIEEVNDSMITSGGDKIAIFHKNNLFGESY